MSVHYDYVIHAKLLTMVQTYQGNRRDYTSNMRVAFYNNNHSPKLYNFQGFIYQSPTTQNCA